jgi:DNA-binding GntR family transcriptional regulator
MSGPVNQRERAYASFTEKLLARDIHPGQFISQRELVEVTGMPLAAIREMIPRLEAEGLIRTVPQRGLQVAHIDLSLIRNAYQLRMIIEREAVRRFCASAEDAEIEAFRRAHAEMRDVADAIAVDEASLDRAQKLDWRFHDRMVDSLENALVSDVHRVNSIKIRLIRQSNTRILPALMHAVMNEHLEVIEALAARDADAADAALTAHIDTAMRRALGV